MDLLSLNCIKAILWSSLDRLKVTPIQYKKFLFEENKSFNKSNIERILLIFHKKNYAKKNFIPSKIYWTLNPARIIAITLEITLIIFYL